MAGGNRGRSGMAGAVGRMLGIAAMMALPACTTGKPGTLTVHYDVHGDDNASFEQSVHAGGPRSGRAFGLVEITFHPQYKLTPGAKGCSISEAKVELGLRITLPRWKKGRPVPKSLQRRWAGFERAVRNHEMAHVRIARDYARRMQRHIAAMSSDRGCTDLAGKVRKRIEADKAEHLRAHDRFDAKTQKRINKLL